MMEPQSLLSAYAEDQTALFSSAERAIRFAWAGATYSSAQGTLGSLQGGGRTPVMSRDERVAQAAMIQRRLEQLRPTDQALLYVRLGPRSVQCVCARACCSGRVPNLQYLEAVGRLSDAIVEVLSGAVTVYHQRAMIVRKWGGEKKIMLEEVADRTGVHRNTLSKHWGLAKPFLQKAYGVALQRAEHVLGADNLVVSAEQLDNCAFHAQ